MIRKAWLAPAAALLAAFAAMPASTPSMAQGSNGNGQYRPYNGGYGGYNNGNDGYGTAPDRGAYGYGDGDDRRRGNGSARRVTVARWHGSVDDVVDIYIQQDRFNTQVISGQGLRNDYGRIISPLPNRPGRVVVTEVSGRGRVYVFQQPNRGNGFTAGVRIEDFSPGRSDYEFTLAYVGGYRGPGQDRDGDRDGGYGGNGGDDNSGYGSNDDSGYGYGQYGRAHPNGN